MGGLSNALMRAASQAGVKLASNAAVQSINVSNEDTGQVTGVTLHDGTVIEATRVISNTTMAVTLDLLGGPTTSKLRNEHIRDISSISYESGCVKINLALNSLPQFSCCPPRNGVPSLEHQGTMHFEYTHQQIERAYGDAAAGRISERPVVEMVLPSAVDASLCPPGKHVALLLCQYAPYDLMKDKETQDLFVRRCLDVVEESAPGFIESIIGKEVLSGPELEDVFGLTGGNICHGAMTFDQLFFFRPTFHTSSYRTPIPGLYICGASCHPGGGVMGAAGCNAAGEIIADRDYGIIC